MSGQQAQISWAIHSSLHQPREKNRHLGASLLLTSSFAHHKQYLRSQKRERMEHQANTHANYHQQVLQAKRINERQADTQSQPHSKALSSIDELKTHARKLMDEHTTKLGKENELQPTQEVRITTAESEHLESGSSFRVCKKPNKRRIVKGRPEMYAVSRRRAFLLNLLEEEKPDSQQPKGIIHELLNKNNLLKFISTQNQKAQSHNLYENLERHKTLEEVNVPNVHLPAHRKSLTNFKNNEGGRARLQQLSKHGSESENDALKGYVCRLKKRRYSSIKTIE